MPRIAAKDTPVQRKLAIVGAITRRLDELPDDAIGRVLTWMDGLVDGKAAENELRAMKAIAAQLDGVEVPVRDSVVRFLNEEYSARPEGTESEPEEASPADY